MVVDTLVLGTLGENRDNQKALQSGGAFPASRVSNVDNTGGFVILPSGMQDEPLAQLMERTIRAMLTAHLTTQDLLDALPRARANVVRRAYSAEFLAWLEQQSAALHPTTRAQ